MSVIVNKYLYIMKKLFILIFLLSISLSYGQQTIYDTISHDGLQRSFILYVPTSYSSNVSSSLIVNFHGYGSNALEQMLYSGFFRIADTSGFLVVHPNGTIDTLGQTYWNAGWGGAVDDIGFTAALIDSLSSGYNIDPERVYSTGMSNGGFMSYALACSLSDRIAAVASVTGSMAVTQIPVCSPQHPMPVMQIHGTADFTVPYNGIPGMVEPIANVIGYWVNFNHCDTTPVFTLMPDINVTDGCTAEHYLYQNGTNGVEVEHYKIIGGGHTWPGAPFIIGITNYDISASMEIWKFFNKYDINGRIISSRITNLRNTAKVNIYPNPAQDYITIVRNEKSAIYARLKNISGVEVRNLNFTGSNTVYCHVDDLSPGMYFLQVYDADGRLISINKIIKQ